jgi:hypothetical protein
MDVSLILYIFLIGTHFSVSDPTMVPYCLLTLLLHSHLIAIIQGGGMKTLYEWSGVDFTWPSSRIRDNAIRDGKYDPSKVAILDVDVFDRKLRSF